MPSSKVAAFSDKFWRWFERAEITETDRAEYLHDLRRRETFAKEKGWITASGNEAQLIEAEAA